MNAPDATLEARFVTAPIVLHPDGNGFIPEPEAAQYLGYSVRTVQRIRDAGDFELGPEVRCVRGSWRYAIQALDRWLEEQNIPHRR